MSFCPTTPAKLYSVGNDEYARESVTAVGGIPILIQESNGWQRGNNAQALNADAVAMVLPRDLESLVDDGRIEGYLLQVTPFSQKTWFRVDSVAVARDLLLCNEVMHYELSLVRSKAPKRICEAEDES